MRLKWFLLQILCTNSGKKSHVYCFIFINLRANLKSQNNFKTVYII